jgi:hypothetical protein
MSEAGKKELEQGGSLSLTPEEGVGVFQSVLKHPRTEITGLKVSWEEYATRLPVSLSQGILSDVIQEFGQELIKSRKGKRTRRKLNLSNEFHQKLLDVSEGERPEFLAGYLETEVKKVLGLDAEVKLDRKAGLISMGMDSLMAVEFKNRLNKSLGTALSQPVPVTLIFNYPNIEAISGYLLQEALNLQQNKIQEKKLTALTVSNSTDPITTTVASLWSRIFLLPNIKMQDDFFELGGDQDVADQMMKELALIGLTRQSGSILRSCSKFIDLVENIRTENLWDTSFYRLLTMGCDFSLPHLYFTAPLVGGLSYVHYLTSGLKNPCFGLEVNQALYGKTTKELVHYFADRISSTSNNNFCVCGYSSGTVLAFGIAKEMEARGKKARNLVLIDAFPSFQSLDEVVADRLWSKISPQVLFEAGIKGGWTPPQNDLSAEELEMTKKIVEFFQELSRAHTWIREISGIERQSILAGVDNGFRCQFKGTPSLEPYSGRVSLILPDLIRLSELSFTEKLCSSDLEKYFASGTHYTVSTRPETREIFSKVIKEHLEFKN